MRTIKLLKLWLGHDVGDTVNVDNNVAFGLVDSGSATYDLTQKKVIDEMKETKEMSFGKRKKKSYKIK